MPAGSVEERAQRIRNLGAECTIMEVVIAVGIVVIFINVIFIFSVTIVEVIVTIVVFANIMNSSFRSTMMHVSISLAPLRKNQVTRCFIISLLACLQYFEFYHNIILGGLLIMDTAVEEDTEEERKMPLAIMQGYMTIIQVRVILKSKLQSLPLAIRYSEQFLELIQSKDYVNHFHF